jgi:outer membrane protein, multidrug efflux system
MKLGALPCTLLATCAVLLAGCASTTEPWQPPPGWHAEQFVHASATAAEPVVDFWRGFNDAPLNSLISTALSANTDLRLAAARLAEVRALTQGTAGSGRPTLDVQAGAARVRAPNVNGGGTQTGNQFTAGLASSWELDLFGRIGFEQRAAMATEQAALALLRGTQLSVAAEVARSYFELRGLQEQLRVAQAALTTQSEALKLVQARLEAGRGTALDTERAQALVQTTAAAVPVLQAALARTRLRLSVLNGQAPQALEGVLSEPQPLPGLPPTALSHIGSPETLLRRRPDIAAAEQQLLAAQAQRGAARSAVFPTVQLSGALGLNAGRVSELGNAGTFVFNLGASLLWSVIDNGQRQAQVGAASARSDAALAMFDKTVLLALEETEGALVSHTQAQQQTERLFSAAQAAKRASQIAHARFDVGASDFLAVLDAQRELLAAQDRLAQAQTNAATSLVAVYRALAGGWSDAQAPAAFTR